MSQSPPPDGVYEPLSNDCTGTDELQVISDDIPSTPETVCATTNEKKTPQHIVLGHEQYITPDCSPVDSGAVLLGFQSSDATSSRAKHSWYTG